MDFWQQKQRRLVAQRKAEWVEWLEFQKGGQRWDVSRVGGVLDDQLLQDASNVASSIPLTIAASFKSVASTMGDLAAVSSGRFPRGNEGVNRGEKQVLHMDGHAWPRKLERRVSEHFNISDADCLEAEEEFFPEYRPVIDCS